MIGNIKKMKSNLLDSVAYQIPIDDKLFPISDYLGENISFEYLQEIHCVACNRLINKSFAQGYCYPCFISLPQTSECILRPELCRAHKGESRDMEWSKYHCLQDHFVYIALTAGAKVGVTRATQIPTRWIDQGAVQAVKLAKTSNRYEAGVIEIELKKYISDRTSWQKMLKNDIDYSIDIVELKNHLINQISKKNHKFILENSKVVDINYPYISFPEKVKSVNFLKESKIEGKLIAVKGQYLLFNNDQVLNIRKHSGFKVSIDLV